MSRALSREQIERLIEGVNLAGSREEAEALIREANNKPSSRADEEYAAKRERKSNAWRLPPSPGVWGERDADDPKAIELHKAFMRFHQTGEAAPLTAALRSPGAIDSVNPESIARLKEVAQRPSGRCPHRRTTQRGMAGQKLRR